MLNVQDLTINSYTAFDLAKIIEGGNYTNILYYEFHEEVDADGIYNCWEGFEWFIEQSQEFYEIFIDRGYEDEFPAVISIAVRISETWYIAEGIGFNYYTGTAPRGILTLREACFNKKILARVFNQNFRSWVTENLSISSGLDSDLVQFEKIMHTLRYMAVSMQKTPRSYDGLSEEDIRDRLWMPLNTIFEGRASAESKNVCGKTDLMIKTEDGMDEHVFELKVWNGIKGFVNAIEQLRSYISWHNGNAGLIIFSYVESFSNILDKMFFTLKDIDGIGNVDMIQSNEFRFQIYNQSDDQKSILTHLLVVNLK